MVKTNSAYQWRRDGEKLQVLRNGEVIRVLPAHGFVPALINEVEMLEGTVDELRSKVYILEKVVAALEALNLCDELEDKA